MEIKWGTDFQHSMLFQNLFHAILISLDVIKHILSAQT